MEKVREIREQLRSLNIRLQPKKGQVFLINPLIIQKIVSTAELKKDELVLEIGAGWGQLTRALAEKAKRVVALEIDQRLAVILREKFKEQKNVKIIQADILKIESSKLKIENYKLVANLPYNITGAVLRKFLSQEPKPSLMVLMLQKEVAQRILPKNKKNSIISLMVNFYSQPEIVQYVSKNNFWPKPKVDSAILKIKTRKKVNLDTKEHGKFLKLIKTGFSSPRKQLINNLAKIIDREKLKEVFNKSKINPQIRAEDLTLKDWLSIYQLLQITN